MPYCIPGIKHKTVNARLDRHHVTPAAHQAINSRRHAAEQAPRSSASPFTYLSAELAGIRFLEMLDEKYMRKRGHTPFTGGVNKYRAPDTRSLWAPRHEDIFKATAELSGVSRQVGARRRFAKLYKRHMEID